MACPGDATSWCLAPAAYNGEGSIDALLAWVTTKGIGWVRTAKFSGLFSSEFFIAKRAETAEGANFKQPCPCRRSGYGVTVRASDRLAATSVYSDFSISQGQAALRNGDISLNRPTRVFQDPGRASIISPLQQKDCDNCCSFTEKSGPGAKI